jgi:hypothetical protein
MPVSDNGFSVYHLESLATVNAQVVKAAPAVLYGWAIYNSNAAARKVVFHNAATTPTAGAGVYFTVVLPGGALANVFAPAGIQFGTGLAITTVTGLADSSAAAVAADDLNINLFYS